MNTAKPTTNFRESCVSWLGKIPREWKLLPLKRLARIQNGRDYKEVAADDGAIPVIGSGGEFARATKPLFSGESVLLGRKGTIDKPLYVNGPFWPVDTMFYTLIDEDADGRFVYYLAKSIPFSYYSSSTALPSMTQEDLSSHVVATPLKVEQTRIATALDRETARIDALIEKKTRFIELLKEKRQALITQAVTKGLDPTVPMKDSGVEWIGEVPAHWQVCRLKHLNAGALKYGANESGDADILEGPRYIRITDLSEDGSLKPDGLKRLPEKIARPYMLEDGDILLARSGATVGKSFIYKAEFGPSCFAGYLIRVRLDDVQGNPDFISLVMQSKCFWDYIRSTTIQATIENVSAERYGDFALTVPSLDEQLQIVEWLSARLRATDAIAAKTRRSIELLTERRSALITAAVTGQIDLQESTA